jgi:hypothetical protein
MDVKLTFCKYFGRDKGVSRERGDFYQDIIFPIYKEPSKSAQRIGSHDDQLQVHHGEIFSQYSSPSGLLSAPETKIFPINSNLCQIL